MFAAFGGGEGDQRTDTGLVGYGEGTEVGLDCWVGEDRGKGEGAVGFEEAVCQVGEF